MRCAEDMLCAGLLGVCDVVCVYKNEFSHLHIVCIQPSMLLLLFVSS